MLSKEYLDTARTILRAAQTMTDRHVARQLKALAEDYERRAEKAASLMSPRHQLARLRCLRPDWLESSVLRPLISNILLVARSAADLVRRPCTTLRPEPRPSSRLDLYLWAPRVPLFFGFMSHNFCTSSP